jgi:hypothetical protein
VEIIQRCTAQSSNHVMVRLPDDTRCALPIWMLEESYCASLVEREQPLIALETLWGLVQLLDLQGDLGCSSAHEPKQSSPTAASTSPTTSTVAALGGTATVATGSPPGMLKPVGAAPGGRRQSRKASTKP